MTLTPEDFERLALETDPDDEQEARLERMRLDYRRTFGGEYGKRVLEDMMRRHFVFACTMVPGDAHETAFNEGRRCVVLDIMRQMAVSEADLLKLQEEIVDD